jgi:hypothetical protein
METKPFDLGATERVVKFFGGDKQKILQAFQSGALQQFAPPPMDQTLVVAAGMLADRMRSAAMQQAAPQQTVAQQVFAPPAPPQPPMGAPAGLGATPQAAAMPPMNATPPMGAVPPQGMPAPQGEMPMMAEGGMVPPYASGGGLSDLPVPDGMFDEPSNGGFGDGYAGGGIVAFADAGPVKEKLPGDVNGDGVVDGNDILVSAPQKTAPPKSLGAGVAFDMPDSIAGMSSDMMTNLTNYQDMYTPERKQQDRLIASMEEELTPESIKKAKKQDMWMALAQIGAKMATTPGSILQAASAGISEALPGVAASAKERKADQRQLLKNLQEQEGLTNKEAKEAANIALDMQVKYGSLYQALQDTSFKERWAQMDDATRRYIGKLTADSSAYSTRMGYLGTMGSANLALTREYLNQDSMARKSVDDSIGPGGALAFQYGEAVKAGKGGEFYQGLLRNVLGRDPISTTGSGGYGAPPPGAVERQK